MACTSSKWGKFWLWSSIWPWRSRSIIPQNNRALNQGLLHLWSKFGDPSLNGWWVIARTNSWLTDTQTHAGNDNTRRPKLASGNKNNIYSFHLCMILGNRDEAWPMYHVWPISKHFMLGLSGGMWPACCHWLNTDMVAGRCPIVFVLTQSYPYDKWFVCSTLQELVVSNPGQLLFCLTITWSRYRNAYRDLWIMTIGRPCFILHWQSYCHQ